MAFAALLLYGAAVGRALIRRPAGREAEGTQWRLGLPTLPRSLDEEAAEITAG